MRTCSVEGCDKKHLAKGLCSNCYMKNRRITKPHIAKKENEMCKSWRERNPDKMLQLRRKWNANNPEKVKEMWRRQVSKFSDEDKKRKAKNHRLWTKNSLSDFRVKIFLDHNNYSCVPEELLDIGRKLLTLKRELK